MNEKKKETNEDGWNKKKMNEWRMEGMIVFKLQQSSICYTNLQ